MQVGIGSEDQLSYHVGADFLWGKTGSYGCFSAGFLAGYQTTNFDNFQVTIDRYIANIRVLYHYTDIGNNRTSFHAGLQPDISLTRNRGIANSWTIHYRGGPVFGARHLFGENRHVGVHAEIAVNASSIVYVGATLKL